MEFPYVKVFEDALSEENCKILIDEFENSSLEYIHRDIDGYIKFTELNLHRNPKWENVLQSMVMLCNYYTELYKKEFNIDKIQFPEEYGFEEMRMKRYLVNDYDEFRMHVDVEDYVSASRFVSFLFYLNDVEEGGETTFGRNNEIVIKPKRGNLLMFPPLWTHIHTGKKPISGSKYILTTYLKYPT